MKLEERVRGSLIGGAIGDALGGPHEGRQPPCPLTLDHLGALSDDTQLTLAMCEAIMDARRVDPEAVARRMLSWFRSGRVTGLGASTAKALSELDRGGHWALVGRKGDDAAGNGAAMRIAPVAFILDPGDRNDRRTIRDVCRITHHNEEAYVGALAVVWAIRLAIDGIWTGTDEQNLLRLVAERIPDTLVRDRVRELAERQPCASITELAKLGTSGYVVDSVPLALLGAEHVCEWGFDRMLERLVGCGGDTDTIASIAGQVAGSLIGIGGIPAALISPLVERELVDDIAQRFCRTVLPAV